ncbi:hypothetical protein DERP_004814 [Dermatophagoides pteronyssinus]|uniref:Uncharacterized protein n=1 Tax=Dermatophagoides pteronyssinus TaxID=6956 RepID=A0ABQ8JSM6_DERPT|nr:hypothetical protein DERP_004814 [Dermatophagoides pteronyssinus]
MANEDASTKQWTQKKTFYLPVLSSAAKIPLPTETIALAVFRIEIQVEFLTKRKIGEKDNQYQ